MTMILPQFDTATVRAKLEAANIVHLIPAARSAGLQFRNGALNKAQIIDALWRMNLGRQALQALLTIQDGGATQATAQAPSMPMATPQPAPATPVPSTPPSAPSAPTDLVSALRAAIGPAAVNAEQVREIVQGELSSLDLSIPEETILSIVRGEVSKLPQGTVIHLPGKAEPIKFEGAQHAQFGDLLTCLQRGLNVYLVGGASSGKTFAAEQAAKALERKFYAQGAITYAHELLGYVDANSRYVRTQMRDAFENGGLILLDEFDASSPEAALVVNAALANGFCAFPDGMIQRHPDFLCVVGANTDGSGATMSYSGRARLDGAFLDRFVQIEWAIDPNIEQGKARGKTEWLACVRAVRGFMKDRQIHDVGATVRAVDFGSNLLDAGMAREKVLAMTLKRGALVNEWAQILRIPAVAEFIAGF